MDNKKINHIIIPVVRSKRNRSVSDSEYSICDVSCDVK